MDILLIRESTSLHKPIYTHPENPNRIVKIKTALVSAGLNVSSTSIDLVSRNEALNLACKVHARNYIDLLMKLSKEAPVSIDEDTYMDKTTLDLALGSLYLSYIYARENRGAFLITRPPGHHSGFKGRAMGASTQGFCILNNAAGSVFGFLESGVRRVAIIDFDAHHGNGTMEIFYRKPILHIDIHQDPDTLYPHTGYLEDLGEDQGYGYKVNIILPPGTGDDLFKAIIDNLPKILEKYSPEALVISAGFDGFVNDGLADLNLTEKSYYELGSLIETLDIPTITVLEGGYSIGLTKGIVAFIKGLMNLPIEYTEISTTPRSLYRRTILEINSLFEKVAQRIS
ncbi:MAG: histone deacetylase family protein [Desulfurococcaceae archaeon]